MARVVILALAALAAAVVAVPDGRASLHQPKEKLDLPVDEKGAQALPFEEFKRRLLVLRNIGNPKRGFVVVDEKTNKPVVDEKTGEVVLTERGVVNNRIAAARKKGNARTPVETVGLAVDLLRFGLASEAGNVVANMRHGYLGNVTHAHLAAARGDWEQAFTHLQIAKEEPLPTAAELGLTPHQLVWQVKLNNGPLTALAKSRWDETRGPKPKPEDEVPDPIFPVDFTNAPEGVLAPAERDKLPPDALATVQQLLLWFPTDARLYWLLGELYAAQGQFATAQKIMDECTWSLQLGNRKLLRQHREAVTKAAEQAKPPGEEPLFADKPPEPTPHVAFTMRAVWVYIGVVGVLAALVLVRSVLKRRK